MALLVGIFFGIFIISQSFMASSDIEISPGDLLHQYPGYIPLSLSPANIGAFYTDGNGQRVYVTPSGSGSFVNFTLSYPSQDFYLYRGITYDISTHIAPYSIVYFTVDAASDSLYTGYSTYTGSSFNASVVYGSSSLSIANTAVSSFSLRILDSYGNNLGTFLNYPVGSVSRYSFIVDHPIDSFIIECVRGSPADSLSRTTFDSWNINKINIDIDVYSANYDHYLPLIYDQTVTNGQYLHHISVNSDTIVQYLQDLSVASGSPSEMEKFESGYLDKMDNQLSQVEDMMSSANPALPNGGDIAGFTSDVQNGLGVNGSSFDASAFSAATSAFSGASATEAGGPWEFFTQSVADSLSGDAMSVGLADDDYIYAWLDEMQRRYGIWVLSSP